MKQLAAHTHMHRPSNLTSKEVLAAGFDYLFVAQGTIEKVSVQLASHKSYGYAPPCPTLSSACKAHTQQGSCRRL